MMSELSSLIAKECNSAKQSKIYTFSHPKLYNGAEFKIRPLSTKRYYYLVDLCTKDGTLDAMQFNAEIICECLVDPDLRDENFLAGIGCLSPEETLAKVFPLPGVLKLLREKIEEVSGWYDPDTITFQQCEESN